MISNGKLGLSLIQPSKEYFAGGPTKQELACHDYYDGEILHGPAPGRRAVAHQRRQRPRGCLGVPFRPGERLVGAPHLAAAFGRKDPTAGFCPCSGTPRA